MVLKTYFDNLRTLCYTNNITFKIDMLKQPIQNKRSEFCGAYACFGVIELFKNPFKTVGLLFNKFKSRTKIMNDRRISNYVIKRWPESICSLNLSSNPNSIKIVLTDRRLNKKIFTAQFCSKMTYGSTKCL